MLIGNETQWVGIGLGGFVFAVVAFVAAVLLAARRARIARFVSGVALAIAGFVGTVVVSFLTYREPASGPRIGEAIVPLTWGMAWGFYAFGAVLLAMVLTASRRKS